jgi:hypothetical protein
MERPAGIEPATFSLGSGLDINNFSDLAAENPESGPRVFNDLEAFYGKSGGLRRTAFATYSW